MKFLPCFLPCFIAMAYSANAQHCAPIYQSYLSEISVKWVEENIRMRLEYTKEGGSWPKKSYQAYFIAYLDRDSKKVPELKGKKIINPKVALVLHTQLIKLNEKNTYDLMFTISEGDLVNRVIKHLKLTEEDRTDAGIWYNYKNSIRIAIFIPFLDDKEYSNLKGLPEDRHECNYQHARALVFQALPFRFDFSVGKREDVQGKVWVTINSDKL